MDYLNLQPASRWEYADDKVDTEVKYATVFSRIATRYRTDRIASAVRHRPSPSLGVSCVHVLRVRELSRKRRGMLWDGMGCRENRSSYQPWTLV